MITVLIGISVLSFILANISNIEPAEAYAIRISKTANVEIVERYREELGFNQPISVQYFNWLKNVICLDFGSSYITGRPVLRDLLSVTFTQKTGQIKKSEILI